MKAIFNAMRIEYQKEAYREVINEEFVSKKWDAQAFKAQMIENVATTQVNSSILREYLVDSFKNCGYILDKILQKTPFKRGSTDYKKLRISIMLNCLNSLKTKGKMVMDNNTTVILWKLPKSMSSYVRLLTKEYCAEMATDVSDCFAATAIDAETAEKILTYQEGMDSDYEEQY